MRIQLTIRDTSGRDPGPRGRRGLPATDPVRRATARAGRDEPVRRRPPRSGQLDRGLAAAARRCRGPGRRARPTARPVTSPWELWVLAGPDVGLRIPLPTGRSIVGRSDDALVRLTDLGVSRQPRADRRDTVVGTERDRPPGEERNAGMRRPARPLRALSRGRRRRGRRTHPPPAPSHASRRRAGSAGRRRTPRRPARRAVRARRAGGGPVPGGSLSGRAHPLSVGGAGCSIADGRSPRCSDALADHAAVRTDRAGALASRAGWASGEDGARTRSPQPTMLPPSTTRSGSSRGPCPGNAPSWNGRTRRWRGFWRRSRRGPARCGATVGGRSVSGSALRVRRCGSSATPRPRRLGTTRHP